MRDSFIRTNPRGRGRRRGSATCSGTGAILAPHRVTCPVTLTRYCGSMEPVRRVFDNAAAFAALSDDDLVERVKHLAACERRASVALIRSLIEFDARRLYLRESCSSLFTYCTQ